ncbi:WD40 repeat-like protein [Auriscalpium vulgare]|uniref:WD40 repeat-like protein n=1 Tax=Auriscalpium vulgare TaxID=40419 RepID=A0ACB8R5F5_9AGAM|nr:WD40 repeat-like protein [Auriscalpium vulgare]
MEDSQRGGSGASISRFSAVSPSSTPSNIPADAEPRIASIGRPSSPRPFKPLPIPPAPTTEAPPMGPQGGAIPSNAAGNAGMQVSGPSCKCSLPPAGKKRRNLVACIDGTSNQFSIKNTNVVELYSRLYKDDDQLTYYDSGIGTFVKESLISPAYWKQVIDNMIDTAIAWHFKRIVLSAYQWLSENYQPGDRIFLFGFSRGAYQVRVIAGMIEKVGLLHKGNNNQIPFAYELYVATTTSRKRDTTPDLQPAEKIGEVKSPKDPGYAEQLCNSFKQTLSREDVRVHFVGVWDTVSSVGFARGPSLPETTTGMVHVCACCHALALDENRVKFQPELVNGGVGPLDDNRGKGNVKEVWFAGSHSDVGGGNNPNLKLRQFGASLRWMTFEGLSHGLRMKPFQGSQWQAFRPSPSLTGAWRVMEYIPFRQLSYKDRDSTTRRPHLSRARQVKAGQMIHESVFEIIGGSYYLPLASLPHDLRLVGWDRKALEDLKMIERDVYASAAITIAQLKIANETTQQLSPEHQNTLTTLASSDIGRDSLANTPDSGNILFRALLHQQENRDPVQRSMNIAALAAAITAVSFRPSESTGYSKPQLLDLVSVLAHTPANAKVRNAFEGLFGFRELRICRGHQGVVTSVAFSPDGKCIASGSGDSTVRIWDTQTGQMAVGPFIGHTDRVNSVAFAPDGTRVVSGSRDETIRIWDARTGEMVAGPFTWPACSVDSVDFWFDDGTRVISSSDNGMTQVWDAQSGERVAGWTTGPTNTVLSSKSVTPDGPTHVVSGSRDRTIRIWEAETGKTVAGPFKGHTRIILSVAFSPDGKRVVSSSADETIRIWDAQTGETVVGPLRGHTDAVLSVAYSPNGKLVASASGDGTVRMWDAEVDEQPRY